MKQKIEIADKYGEVLKSYIVPQGMHQFEGVCWEGVHLSGALLEGANFRNANLYWAHLDMAILDGANFEGACLRGSVLRDASCIGTNFHNANLGPDNLGGSTQLQGVNLSKAILNGAKLVGAEYDCRTVFPKGFLPGSHGMIETGSQRDRYGTPPDYQWYSSL